MSSSRSGTLAADSPASTPLALTPTHSAATPTITATPPPGPVEFVSINGDPAGPVDRSADPDHESAFDLEISYQYFLSIKDTEIRSGWVSLVSGALAHRVVRVTSQRQASFPINETTIYPVADRVAQEEFSHILKRISPPLANLVICRAIDLAIPVLLDIKEGVPWFKTGPKRPNPNATVYKASRRGPGIGGYCRFNIGEDMLNLPDEPLSRPAVSHPQGIAVPATEHNSWTAGVPPVSLVVNPPPTVASCLPPAAALATSIAAAHAQTYSWSLPHQLLNTVGVNRVLFPPPNAYVRPQQSYSLTALPSSPLTPMSPTVPVIPPTPSPAPRPPSTPAPPQPKATRRSRSRTLAADGEPSDKPAPKRRQRSSTTTSGRKRRVSEGDVAAAGATSSSNALQGGSTSMPAILEEGQEDDAADKSAGAQPKLNSRQAKKRRTSNVL